MPKPEKTFRLGSCSASVFVNEAGGKGEERRSFRSVSLQRRYKVGDAWKSSTSFTLADLPAVAALAQLSLHYIASKEASTAE
jgi:hypothetical protein